MQVASGARRINKEVDKGSFHFSRKDDQSDASGQVFVARDCFYGGTPQPVARTKKAAKVQAGHPRDVLMFAHGTC